jgi:hypothetical protein
MVGLHAGRYTLDSIIFFCSGNLIRVRLVGMEFIVINSEKTARALLDQRSTIYSDRPVTPTSKLYIPFQQESLDCSSRLVTAMASNGTRSCCPMDQN